jgi:hypothetical protein
MDLQHCTHFAAFDSEPASSSKPLSVWPILITGRVSLHKNAVLLTSLNAGTEGGDAASAYAAAAAEAFAAGGPQATSFADALAAAIAQYGCNAILPLLTRMLKPLPAPHAVLLLVMG